MDLDTMKKFSEMMDEDHCFERWFFIIIAIIVTLYSILMMGKTITSENK